MPHPPFVEILKEKDPELYEIIDKLSDVAMSEGALERKTKALIALALDAFNGQAEGVQTLSKLARNLGASEDEIKETLRIAYYVAGMETLVAGAAAHTNNTK